MLGFAKFQTRTLIEGKITLLTALHIGRGQSLEPIGTDQPVVKDALGNPFIPGSSFKGVLRSNAERIAAALYGNPNIVEPCFITDEGSGVDEECISHEKRYKKLESKIEKLRENKTSQEVAEWHWERLCPICQFFGSPHFSAKLAIKDLPVDLETWFDHYETRDGVAIDRGKEIASDGKLYDFEIVPAGVEFDLEMVVENANERELGLLFLALKDFERGDAFIGGGKTKGLGNVELEFTRIEDIDVEKMGTKQLTRYLLGGNGKVYRDSPELPEIEETEAIDIEDAIPQTPQFEIPETCTTREDLFTMVCAALSVLSTSDRKDLGKIGGKLGELGLSGSARKALQTKFLWGERLGDLFNEAQKAGWVERLDDGQYVPVAQSSDTPEADEPADTEDTDSAEEPEEAPEVPLSEYDFDSKIRAFVNSITESPPEQQEDVNAQEESV